MPVSFVSDPSRRVEIARTILSQLPEWFGLSQAEYDKYFGDLG